MTIEFFSDIEKAVKILKEGGIILYPTDTIWGIGCDSTNSQAVDRIFSLKKRPDSKAMLSLVDSIDALRKWVGTVSDKVIAYMQNYQDPLTVIYDTPKGLADGLIAPDGSAAFRIPKFAFTKELCRKFGKPIVSTSANFTGEKTPSIFDEISPDLKKLVDYSCLSFRNFSNGKPSRIIKISSEDEIKILRN